MLIADLPRSILFAYLPVLALGMTPALAQDHPPAAPTAVAPAAHQPALVDPAAREPETYREHVYFLSNPFLEGRGPGTRGNELASEYVETFLAKDGLRPMFDAITQVPDVKWHRQLFTAGMRAKESGFLLDQPQSHHGKWVPKIQGKKHALGFSGDGFISAPLVFVGYAVQEGGPDKSYNTFAPDDDLSGKIALMFRFEPMDDSGKSRWAKNTDVLWSGSAAIGQKITEVVKRNAAGLIVMNPPGITDPRGRRVDESEITARWTSTLSIPAALVDPDAAVSILKYAHPAQSLLDLRRLADEGGVFLPLGDKPINLTVSIDRRPRQAWNIAATLPGAGNLADQYIILGAHYDHVGYGYTGGSRTDEYGIVHPGADDNASGTAGLLLAADILKRRFEAARLGETGHPDQPRRSIMFVAFSAEEMGLIGSREFIKNCPVSASSIAAMLNMDMIGRLRDNKLEVSGTGTAEGFADILKPLFDASGLTIKASPGGRGPSDHATFYGARIPVLAFFTGLHEEYHTPRDTVDLINIDGAVRVVHLVSDIAQALATRVEPLVFTSTDKVNIGALTAPGDPDAPAVTMGSVKVRFGIAPGNYADDQSGVLVGEVYPGTCAAEAGVQPNDRLIRWNGEPIGDVTHWMHFLAKHKPGDVVDVGIIRAEQEQTLKVTLKSRDQAPR